MSPILAQLAGMLGRRSRALRWRRALPGSGCFIFVAACSGSARGHLRVLPFYNLSKDSSLDWIGESLSQALEEGLAVGGFDHAGAGRSSGGLPAALHPAIRAVDQGFGGEIGEALDAEQVVFGQFELKPAPESAAKSRGSLQITARLLDLRHVKQGPEFHTVGALEDLAALEEHLAWQVLGYVKSGGAPSEADFQRRHPAVRLDAIENYGARPHGRQRRRTSTVSTRKQRGLIHCIRSRAFRLGLLLWRGKEYKSAAEWFQKVLARRQPLSRSELLPGIVPLLDGRFCGRPGGVSAGGAHGFR